MVPQPNEVRPAARAMRSANTVCVRLVFLAALLAALLGAGGRAGAQTPQWSMHAGGVSHHFQPTRAPGHEWQEQHAGLGLERRASVSDDGRSDWSLSTAGGLMQDSRGFWGGYAGAGYLWHWRRYGQIDLGLGGGAYLFYRSVSWSGRMAVVPGLLPLASAHFPASGISLNLIYVPRLSAINEAMPSVLHLQFAYRFR